MQVTHFKGERSVSSVEELLRLLDERHDGRNAFWLTPTTAELPTLSLVVRGEQAYLSFHDESNPAARHSIASKEVRLKAEGTTSVSIGLASDDPISVPNYAIVPVSVAMTAAREFYESGCCPTNIEWFEL